MQTSFCGFRMLGLVAVVTLLQACGGSPKSSSTSGPQGGPVPTSQITLYLTVESDESNTAVVRANLNDGKLIGTSYRLDGGDFLRACKAGVCRNMADNDSVYMPDYIARFPFQSDVDFVVSFNRQEGGNAPNSRVSLPPAFTIVTPANNQQVTDGETVMVSWAPTGAPGRVDVSYQAECTLAAGPNTFSSGMLSTDSNGDGLEAVSIDEIVNFAGSTSTSTITRCSIDLVVQHERDGQADPAFDDGIVVGTVSRKVSLDYVPR